MTTNRALLLVEDNEDDVFLMKRALKEAHVSNQLCVVEDGQEAVDYFTDFHKHPEQPVPVLILCDLNLPILTGRDPR